MISIKVIVFLVLVALALAAIRPGFTQKMADQEKELIRDAIITNSLHFDPRPACAGAYGEELKNLAIQYGHCKR